jgi:hypothetical protein
MTWKPVAEGPRLLSRVTAFKFQIRADTTG